MELQIAGYDIINELGRGNYGEVYKAIRLSDNKLIALKILTVDSGKTNLVTIINEANFLKRLAQPECNPFVICYYGSSYIKLENRFLIEMELVEGQTMKEYVSYLWSEKSPDMVYYYLLLIAKDIIQGIKHTHENGIIHNDIKEENIMIDKQNIPHIIDYGFGCSIVMDRYETEYCKSRSGTAYYAPPEYVIQNRRYPVSDMWALGIALYRSATNGNYPFKLMPKISERKLLKIIGLDEAAKLETTNQQLNNLVNGLLVKDPQDRLNHRQALCMLSIIHKPSL